jgi:hypothetical protein
LKIGVVGVTVVAAKQQMDIADVAQQISDWLVERNFETRTDEAEYGLLVKARKSSVGRKVLAADRALVIRVSNDSGVTEIVIRQGSWVANLTSNVAWNGALIVLTGGGLLAVTASVSAWSFVIQRQLTTYVRKILNVSETSEEEPPSSEQRLRN